MTSRAHPMAERSREQRLVHEVADTVGGLMEFWGFKRLMGRIWATLYLRDEALSAAELCEELDISSGAASMTLTELEHWGVVQRQRKPGDRREYFEAETDVWKLVSRVLRERELSQIERALDTFERAREELQKSASPSEAPRIALLSARIARLSDLARIGKGLLGAVIQQGKADLGPLARFAAALRRSRS